MAFCNGWGLGVETADFWNWSARTYRMFAELLEISDTLIVGDNEVENAIKVVTGDNIINLDMVLHHPGYYYLQATNSLQSKREVMIKRRAKVWGFLAPELMSRLPARTLRLRPTGITMKGVSSRT
jgi:Foie gras liver health family 1